MKASIRGNIKNEGTPATAGMQTAAGKQEIAVTPAMSNSKDDSNSVTADNSRKGSNRNESWIVCKSSEATAWREAINS